MCNCQKIWVMTLGLLALTGCGDDVVVKAPGDVLATDTETDTTAVDAADDTTALTGDVVGADGDAVAPSDAVTADSTGEDAQADVTATDAVEPSDATTPTDDATVADATVDAAEPDAAILPDATTVTDSSGADTAATDAATDDATASDTADATGADASDSLSDTWAPCTSGVSCEDGDPCTFDLCWDLACQHVAIVGCTGPLAPCDGQHPCAEGSGVCDLSRNACVPCVTASDCGDGHACYQNTCAPAVPCKSDVTCKGFGAVCDKDVGVCVECVVDGDCGKGNQCVSGKCQLATPCGTSKECPAVCDLKAGVCVACNDTTDCAAGEACSPLHQCLPATCKTTTCSAGAAFACNPGGWSYGAASTCEDGNTCTTDACIAGTGCKKTLNKLPCDDNNACTSGDVCAFGFCAGSVTNCNDPNVCTADSCDPTKGCQHVAAFGPCDDGSVCTTSDQCADSVCSGKGVSCEDSNVCTSDTCDATIGCRNLPSAVTACDDGDACTAGTACQDGKCQGGTAVNCDDGSACTADSCAVATGCDHAPLTGPTCSDGDACTDGDACANGKCVAQASVCNDNKVCTTDSCDSATGCVFIANTAPCSDGNPCSGPDVCANGSCTPGSIVDCNDNNPCTKDVCNGSGGCTHTPLADKTACDDGDPCTLLDACKAGACTAVAIDCNDKNDCTVDACVAGTCKYVNIAGTCDDGNGCTSGDTCVAGTCTAGKAVDCTVDTKGCGSGVCKSTGSQTFSCSVLAQPDGTSCDADGNGCTVGDACKAGACVTGPSKDCTAGNSADGCKLGVCQSLSATSNTCVVNAAPAETGCNADSSGCTAGDKCDNKGVCVPGPQVDCNQDPAYCTAGICQGTGATTYTCTGGAAKADGTACNADNSGCTLDTCKAGKCQVGAAPDCSSASDPCSAGVCKYASWNNYTCVPAPITCDDNNPCTDDSCKLPGGCSFVANGATCNDNNVCTLGDSCKGGTCSNNTPAVCDDGNACTADWCDSSIGCVSSLTTCDDANPCTVDTCDSVKGCLYTVLPTCVQVNVPYTEPFDCGGGIGWTLGKTVEAGVGWAIDGTAATPGYLSPLCSLNFNNGKDFACNTKMDASAVSPLINGASLPAGTHLAMRFFNNGDYEGSTYDKLSVEITTNSGVNWTELLNVPAPATLGWVLQTIDLTPYAGQWFQVRFRFWTYDCLFNSTVGGFIDDVAIYTTNCGANQPCDDKNPCTTDTCDNLTGQCSFVANTLACGDGNACTAADACKLGVCTGTATNCDDANVCTLDACDGTTGKCTHTAAGAGTACSDSNPCTSGDTCSGTTCAGGPSPCGDANPCTVDLCTNLNGAASCSYAAQPNQTACDDGNACTTGDVCVNTTCAGPTNVCGYSTLYSEAFACNGNNAWSLQSVGTSKLAWAVDATPAVPGYYSASCSLNFNDGVTYGTVLPAVAFATSPSFAMPAKASACKLSLYSWSQLGNFNVETRAIALVDATTGLDLVTYSPAGTADAGTWTQLQVDCMSALGHTAKVQLRFSDASSIFPLQPTGAGWFVDDVQVSVGVQ